MMKRPLSNIIRESTDGISQKWHTPYDSYFIREYYGHDRFVPANNLPSQVLFVHEEHCFEKYYRKREHSEVFSIELVLDGSMIFIQNEKKYRVKPGEVYLVHLDHDNEVTTGPEKHCHRLACGLTGKSLNSQLHSTGLSECNIIKLHDRSKIETIMRTCLSEFKKMELGYRKRAAILAYELLIELGENVVRSRNTELIYRATEIMDHHLSTRLTLDQLAESLGSSRSSLYRAFLEDHQESPMSYFIHLKMEAAKSMLENTNINIKEIANRVGYDNPLYFSTEFRKKIGISPRQYRRNHSGPSRCKEL